MNDDKEKKEGVYGENVPEGEVKEEPGIREKVADSTPNKEGTAATEAVDKPE